MRNISIAVLLCLLQVVVSAQNRADEPVMTFGSYKPVLVGNRHQMPVMSTAGILSDPRFSSNLEGFRVLSFDFSMKPADGDYIGPYSVKGAELTHELMELIKSCSGASGTYYLENIRAIDPEKRVRSLVPVIIKYQN